MAEPPTKRARRTDSSAMWDTNDKRPRLSHTPEADAEQTHHSRHGSSRPEDPRTSTKDDRRYRSRSRDRYPRKRDRSWSRDSYERTRERDRNRDGGKRDSYKDGRGVRDRDRSTSRDRYNRRGTTKSGRPDRSRSPRNGTRSRDYSARDPKPDQRDGKRDRKSQPDQRHTNGASKKVVKDEEIEDADKMSDIEDTDDIEAMMRKAVGFTRFRSTKNTKVPGNDIYGVRKEKKTEYRQYMNRVGGFNRPLSPGR
ncbi:uncharacterized protein BHQ10_001028 [Talaromyces amestolkiae]|uniref:U4/U6.U5 small nuclear ribonucleoprotein 27kDa protein domain-containing protein n=1 Tax=Talaromyces amestolkiae TaxID=1196081 RepID=A0A364KN85_TALAM|nr:uncharacterized protein BHQ10_001028 [Talaromyces amestolkiae]RAO65016.1 hypothetical protein BHQ10_001028 [Talaromyces amestolkiae]